MALTLQQIRDFVRLHIDLEVEDLPDEVLDFFVREGSRRIERAEPRWPFYEVSVPLGLLAGTASVLKSVIAADLDQVTAIEYTDVQTWPPLAWIGFDAYNEERSSRPVSGGRPIYFSEWSNSVFFFPTPDIDYNFNVHGYRRPADWVAGGAGAVPDLPEELHSTVATWALSKAYSQQEDSELASLYERQYADELNEFRRRLVITPHNQPLILNGGVTPQRYGRPGRFLFDFETS